VHQEIADDDEWLFKDDKKKKQCFFWQFVLPMMTNSYSKLGLNCR
jgi:hypothetical protein